MVLEVLQRYLIVKVKLKLKLDPRDPSTLIYDNLLKHMLDECVIPNPVVLLDSEGIHTSLEATAY
jgi:hypothetical protein